MDLPDECWELIFSKLGHQYHLDTVSLVCKRFLSISNFLRHSLTICDLDIYHGFDLSRLFRRFSQLKKININSNNRSYEPHLDRIMVELAQSGLNLEEVNLYTRSNILLPGLRELGSNMKKLTTLRCSLCALSDSDLLVIASSMPRLQELDISYPRGLNYEVPRENFVTDEGIEWLACNLKELRKINIAGCHLVTDKSHFALFSYSVLLSEVVVNSYAANHSGAGYALRYCPNLDSLSVCVNFLLTSAAPITIENSISYARALSALDFFDSELSDTLLYAIAQAHLPLKKLGIRRCKVTFSGLLLLLREYQSLNELNLETEPSLTDQNINHLSEFLPKVTHISLSGCYSSPCKFTSSTLFILARSCPLLVDIRIRRAIVGRVGIFGELVKNSRIQYLELRENFCLNDEILSKVAYVCPNLKMVDLSKCSKITEKGVGQILKSCSGLRHLKINRCSLRTPLGTDSANSILNIEVLEACGSFLGDEGMSMIGMRCPNLLKLKLNLTYVTAKGVKEVVGKCSKLMEIHLNGCGLYYDDVVNWMALTKPSLRITLTSIYHALPHYSPDSLTLLSKRGLGRALIIH